MINKHLRISAVMLAIFTLLTGGVYPALVTGIAHVCFPERAGGSIICVSGHPAGSTLIGQPFTSPGYFWSRPSATQPYPYNAAASAGSNLAPSNPALLQRVRHEIARLHAADSGAHGPVPVDLVTASASGLDPHISPAAALFQVPRVARIRGIAPEYLRSLIGAHTEGLLLGVFGEPRVNVLELNLALDATTPAGGRH